MEIAAAEEVERIRDALSKSKETTLTSPSKEAVLHTDAIQIVMSEPSTKSHVICHLCGKVLPETNPSLKNYPAGMVKFGEDSDFCSDCIESFTLKKDKEGSESKRDSGFHTLNRGDDEHVDTGQRMESGVSTTSSADSAVSVSDSDTQVFFSQNANPSIKISSAGKISAPLDGNSSNNDVWLKHSNTSEGRLESPVVLADKLFHFKGYKRTDIARILGKNTPYNKEVAKEYLKFFNFEGETLINSYRDFLSHFALLGETQERERVLLYFSSRYADCNPDFLDQSPDSVHTLVCALTLLNTDLHGNVGLGGRKKMTYKQFAANLSGLMANGQDYPKDLLVVLYSSVKKHPLPWGGKESRTVSRSSSARHNLDKEFIRTPTKIVNRSMSSRTAIKVSKTVADSSKAGLGRSAKLKPLSENHGLLWRKTLIDSDGKKVPLGKRSWRVYSVTLQNLELHMTKKGSNEVKTISIHHCLAEETVTDSKRSNVFKLALADSSITLFQANSVKEVKKWIRDINKAAALLSAAPLCSPIGSQMVFRKALLPSAPSTLPSMNQLNKLQQLLKEHKDDHAETVEAKEKEKSPSDSVIQYYKDKLQHLEYEIKKYKCYVKILQIHLRTTNASNEELKSDVDKSDNGSLLSVTPSEPPLASPSALDTHENSVFPDTSDTLPVLSPPRHFITPQHHSSLLNPTSSLPNLSPILESPSKVLLGGNREFQRKIKLGEMYESSLNDSVGSLENNANNSNGILKWENGKDVNAVTNRATPKLRAEIQTTIIRTQPFPVKRYEMRVAEMDSQVCESMSVNQTNFTDSFNPDMSSERRTLTRVRGRTEKKGIDRYSYLQAVSPIQNIN